MKQLDKRLIRMIRHSKGQFYSIVAIVSAALAIYVLFNVTTINVNQAVAIYYDQMQINHIHVSVVKAPQTAVKEILGIDGVVSAQGRVAFDVPLETDDPGDKVRVRFISLPDTGATINQLYAIGKDPGLPKDNQVIALQQFAVARDLKPGDVLTPYIGGREQKVEVTGVAANPEFVYLMENEQALLTDPARFGVLYVSEAFAQSAYGYEGSYNEILVRVDDLEAVDDIAELVEDQLDKYGVKRITTLENQLSNNVLRQKIDGIEQMSVLLPSMFLLVGAIIIVIMLSRIVSNDRMAIGVLKALGYSSVQVLVHYAKYALLIGFLGSVIGIVLGYIGSRPLSEVFVYYFNIPVVKGEIYLEFIVGAIVLTSVFCITSGLIGARAVLAIQPADAMRPEAPKSGKRILLERIKWVWRHIAFSWKMVIRNAMRTKKRFVFLAFGLALAYAINVVPSYMSMAMPVMFGKQYSDYQTMAYTVQFKNPVHVSAMKDLAKLVDVSAIEPRIDYPFQLENGWYKTSVGMVGVPQDTTLNHFYNTKDIEIPLIPGTIYLTESLAKALHVDAGDLLTVNSFIPGKEDVHIPVGAIVRQYLGSSAFMELETMQSLLMDKDLITGVSLNSDSDVKKALEDAKNVSAVMSSKDIQDDFSIYLDTIVVAVNAYMLFGGILCFAIIYNATVIGISERRLEFSSLRIMGFTKKDVFKIVTRENGLLVSTAILIGIPLGMGMIQAMGDAFNSEMITFPVFFPPAAFITSAVSTLAFVFIAQMAARKKIYRMDFIEALKSRIS